MKPLIGISAWYAPFKGREGLDLAKLNSSYVAGVHAAGGQVVILSPSPRADPAETAADLVRRVDGLLLSGGEDFDPAAYGQQPHEQTKTMPPLRQAFELALAAEADRARVPVFGICLGIQTVALARGGALHQHVADVTDGAICHKNPWSADPPLHEVRIAPASRLRRIIGADAMQVNSRHHQAVAEPGAHLRITATAPDGLIEAVEDDRPDRWLLAVQWHPEDICDRADHLALFQAHVEASADYAANRDQGRMP
jgi:putative glutamine amidotransferase